ncbi:MAG: SpaH/EbpB family LPXTG-anchored major pilin [Clostridia bacterium]|nr:SpaH/EbpB family LPXTG-anchored major pilin [Clostridia bacterium]
MKKKVSKIFAIIIAAIMLLACSSTISHATITTSTNTGKITVDGVEAGVNVTVYQLTTVNYDYTADQPTATPYEWIPAVKTWIHTNYPTYENPENFNSEDISSDTAKAFYDALTAAIKAGTITVPAANTETKPATGTAAYPVVADKKVEFTDKAMGTYLVVIENGYRVYTPSAVNLTPTFNTTNNQWELASNVNVEIKSTTPQIKKTVTDNVKQADNYSTKDDIPFTIVADIPTYLTSSRADKYTISDVLNDGLNLKNGTIRVYGVSAGGTETELTANEAYTLTTTNAKNNAGDDVDYSVDFDYDDIKTYSKVKITYTATLDKSASTVEGSAANNGTAYLDYSNNPYDTASVQTQTSSTKVFTYGAQITKTDKADSTRKLPGAEFTLSQGANALYFVNVSGVYYQANSTDSGATTTLVTDSNGLLKLYGLDAGTYVLTETKAPNGYTLATNTVSIEIKDDNVDGTIEGTGVTSGATGIYTLDFPNPKGFQLPVTGGIGTTLFIAGGIVFVGIGIALFAVAVKRRKK